MNILDEEVLVKHSPHPWKLSLNSQLIFYMFKSAQIVKLMYFIQSFPEDSE